MLLNSSSDVIIKLSTDLKILEFNPEAEKFFGKKSSETLNQNFIQLFVPEPVQKKTEKDLNGILKRLADGKLNMQVIAVGSNVRDMEWSANVLEDHLKMATGIIIMTKK